MVGLQEEKIWTQTCLEGKYREMVVISKPRKEPQEKQKQKQRKTLLTL